jgi:hypothetical protein
MSTYADLGGVLLLDAGIAALVGYRLPGVWYLGVLGTWPAVVVGATNLIVGLSSPAVAHARGGTFVILIGPIVVTLYAGYGAAALARRRSPLAPP